MEGGNKSGQWREETCNGGRRQVESMDYYLIYYYYQFIIINIIILDLLSPYFSDWPGPPLRRGRALVYLFVFNAGRELSRLPRSAQLKLGVWRDSKVNL